LRAIGPAPRQPSAACATPGHRPLAPRTSSTGEPAWPEPMPPRSRTPPEAPLADGTGGYLVSRAPREGMVFDERSPPPSRSDGGGGPPKAVEGAGPRTARGIAPSTMLRMSPSPGSRVRISTMNPDRPSDQNRPTQDKGSRHTGGGQQDLMSYSAASRPAARYTPARSPGSPAPAPGRAAASPSGE